MAKSKQNPTTGLYTYGNSTVYDPSKETNLNTFNDWAQKNPNSAAKYGANGGTYNGGGADLTPGSGAAANNYTGTQWNNTNTPAVQTGYSSNILSGTGATNAAGSWDAINTDNFDSSFDAGMNEYKTAPIGGIPTESGGMFDDWTKTGAGGSKFSNAAAGLGSLYGIYAAHQGIGAAKDALNFQKQQYADQQAQQARANKKQDDFGLALSSAMPAKRVG